MTNGVTGSDEKFTQTSLVASSPLCDSMLVEIKWINVSHNITVFSNC
jgi:hypothetical protein